MRGQFQSSDQLCWECGNATGGCSWSKSLTPVDGWKAEYKHDKRLPTYHVYECPEFTKEENENVYTEHSVRTLCLEIVRKAATDYMNACKAEALWRYEYMKPWRRWADLPKWLDIMDVPAEMKALERFFMSEYALMITDGNPMYIMNRIRDHEGIPPIYQEEI